MSIEYKKMISRIKNKNSLSLLLFVLLSFLFSSTSIYVPWSQKLDYNDSAIYKYIGYLITKGETPYLDAFDHKGIYFYFLNALGYSIHPKWGMWLIIWCGIAISMYLVLRISKKYLSDAYSVVAVLIFSSFISGSYWEGDIPDFFATVFNLISYNCLLNYVMKRDLTSKDIFVTGCAASFSFWMKPNMILGTIIFCSIILIDSLIAKNYSFVWKCISFFTIGFIICTLPGLVWLFSRNALVTMVEDYFLFNTRYTSFYSELQYCLNAFSFFCKQPLVYASFIEILMVLILLIKNCKEIKKHEFSMLFVTGVITFIISLLHISSTGNSYKQYLLLLVPSLLLLYICFIKLFNEIINLKSFYKIIVMGSLLVIVLIYNLSDMYQYIKIFWKEYPLESEEVEYITKNSKEGDTIASVSPYNTGLYLATGRDSATENIYVQLSHFWNIMDDPDREEEFWEEYTNSLIQAKPRFIIYETELGENDKRIKEILNECLKDYKPCGNSYKKEFYILPRSSDEQIEVFETNLNIETSLISFEIPQEMIEKYKNGEIGIDEFMELFDQEFSSLLK